MEADRENFTCDILTCDLWLLTYDFLLATSDITFDLTLVVLDYFLCKPEAMTDSAILPRVITQVEQK